MIQVSDFGFRDPDFGFRVSGLSFDRSRFRDLIFKIKSFRMSGFGVRGRPGSLDQRRCRSNDSTGSASRAATPAFGGACQGFYLGFGARPVHQIISMIKWIRTIPFEWFDWISVPRSETWQVWTEQLQCFQWWARNTFKGLTGSCVLRHT